MFKRPLAANGKRMPCQARKQPWKLLCFLTKEREDVGMLPSLDIDDVLAEAGAKCRKKTSGTATLSFDFLIVWVTVMQLQQTHTTKHPLARFVASYGYSSRCDETNT